MAFKRFWQLVAGFVIAALLSSCSSQEPGGSGKKFDNNRDRKPNIIFILADDLGYGDLGSYGQKIIETPNLDLLASEGVRFTDFYAGSTVCAPSRSVLMTGKHLGHNRVRGNARTGAALMPEDVTVAEVLKKEGYTTALVGKWGLGDEGSESTPNNQGFDYFFGFLNQVHAHNHYPEWLWRNDEKVNLKNITEPTPVKYSDFVAGVTRPENRKEYAGDLFIEESLGFIEKNSDRPFFLYLAVTSPHANNEAGKYEWAHGLEVPDNGKYADQNWPESAKGYAAMVDHLDSGVGRVIEKLKQLDIDKNTIVLFSSDNGPHREGGNIPEFFDSNGKLKGIKRDLYDGGIRVPLIVWAPGRVPENIETDHVGYFGDVMATLTEIAAGESPDNLDSVSFLPTLLNQPEHQQAPSELYWEFYTHGSSQAMRSGSWKAFRSPMFTGGIELYDLSIDGGEHVNVATEYPELVARFATDFERHHHPDSNWSVAAKPSKHAH